MQLTLKRGDVEYPAGLEQQHQTIAPQANQQTTTQRKQPTINLTSVIPKIAFWLLWDK